jgi:hypothetical protein
VTGVKDKFQISLSIGSPIAVVNGESKVLLISPQSINGRTFIPLRFISEASKKHVEWNADTRKIQITSTIFSDIYDVLEVADDKDLRYEGEMKNGKKHGEGKLFYLDNLWYEGDFVEDTLSGKGKLYKLSGGMLKYEGQMKDNIMNGQGVFYFDNGKIMYEGQWSEGMYDGFGILYSTSGNLYDGQFSKGIYDGEGRRFDPVTGMIIEEGIFNNGLLEGVVRLYSNGALTYHGEYKSGAPNGKGTLYLIGGYRYVGDLLDGVMTGEGTLYNSDGGIVVKGQFRDNTSVEKPQILVGESTISGITTRFHYTDGYSFKKLWESSAKWSQKIGNSFNPNATEFRYYPEGLPEITDPGKPSYTLLTITKLSRLDYDKNPAAHSMLFEKKDWVYVYEYGKNIISTDETHHAQHDEFNQVLAEMKKILATFKQIDFY